MSLFMKVAGPHPKLGTNSEILHGPLEDSCLLDRVMFHHDIS